MDKKILCVLAGYDDNTEQHLAAMQNKLYEKGFVGTHTKDLPQHITLGTLSVEKETELINLVIRVSQEIKPIDITFNHIGIFNGSNVLFVAPDPNSNLFKLKESFGESYNWTPHTTMLIDKPENIYAALPALAGNFKSFQGSIQNIHLYEFWPSRHILSRTFIK
ncbi:2'-5' RNA ligase family protein [Gorillibacterium massiliense]|uniref:2'-5' RNA ligase family protein n=1 Tax=Gorillibacterium massiliense TaxID=1280390 RepID=UPI0004AD338D|nr:2'-5' RNA ligase family protein [Gorillibacterium massiliense]